MQDLDGLTRKGNAVEEGYYSFRAVARSAEGELQVHYSRSYFIYDSESMKLAKNEFIEFLTDHGKLDIKITHTVPDKEENNYNYIY